MPTTLATSTVESPRQRLENVRATEAKGHLKKLEIERRQVIGRVIARAIKFAGRDDKDVWVALEHPDGAQLSRWIRGTERPQFDRLFAIDWMRVPLLLAFAQAAGIEIETVFRAKLTA